MSAPDHDGNTDSAFLDMITNCVGILIILVMIVGMRAKDAPAMLATQQMQEDIEAFRSQSLAIEDEMNRIDMQLAVVNGELTARGAQRNQLSTLVTAVERDIERRRAALGDQSRGQFDAARDLALAKNELARLEAERENAQKTIAPRTIKIESYPTPLGKTVDDKEAHFHLSGGRIAFVPYEALVERLKSAIQQQASKLDSPSDLTDVLEPVGGFRVRYVLERIETPQRIMVGVSYLEFLPVSSQLGEPVEAALAPRSRFRDRLEMLSPRQYTITVWTYPDSFAEYRRLKKELYGLGYAVAARPLPEGMPIGASPHGSKSSAQ